MASRLRGRAVVLPAAIVLAATGGAVAWAQSGPAAAGYRTAVVGRGDVQQTLTLTGTVSVVTQAKARFRAAGTVSAVKVAVGQTVAAGQVLATMDTGSLSDAVVAARAALATAKATLETDSSTGSTPTATPSASASSKQGSSTGSAQRAAEDALRKASQAVQAAAVACATAPTASPTTTASAAATASATTSASPTSTPTPSAAPKKGAPVLDCATALQRALAAQQATSKAQQDLARALQSSASTPSSSSSDSSSASDSSNRPSQGGSTTSTAAKVTKDTAAVRAAEVALEEAEKDLASVTLTAPIAGTVASIPWKSGGTASPSDAVVLLGRGAVDVVVDVPSTSIRSITVGLPASVRSDGATKPVDGTVTAIGLLPTDTSGSTSTSSTTTYPVTVRVPSGAAMVDGSSVAVTLAVKSVKGVVTVPNSALRGSSVTVLVKGKPTTVRVTTGAKGALTTEVTKGLSVGQLVVIADLSEELPTSSTTTNRNRVGGFNGPPTGTFPGGFQGGPPVTFTRG